MQKILTKFRNFRYSSSVATDTYHITWFILKPYGDDFKIKCFSDNQAKDFINYTLRNTDNFPENFKNSHICTDEDAENFDNSGVKSDIRQIHLTQIPTLEITQSDFLKQVVLVSNNHEDNHTYNLNFDVIGFVTSID